MRIAGDLSYKLKILYFHGHTCIIHEIVSQHEVHFTAIFLQQQPSITSIFSLEVSTLIISLLMYSCYGQTCLVGLSLVVMHSSSQNLIGGTIMSWGEMRYINNLPGLVYYLWRGER